MHFNKSTPSASLYQSESCRIIIPPQFLTKQSIRHGNWSTASCPKICCHGNQCIIDDQGTASFYAFTTINILSHNRRVPNHTPYLLSRTHKLSNTPVSLLHSRHVLNHTASTLFNIYRPHKHHHHHVHLGHVPNHHHNP